MLFGQFSPLEVQRAQLVLSNKKVCVFYYPSCAFLILGFWDVNNKDSDLAVRRYDVHESSVTGLSFDRYDPMRLFTSSRDGSVFWLDLRSGIFDEVTYDIWTVQSTKDNYSLFLFSIFFLNIMQVYSVPISSATEIPTHHVQKDAATLLLSLGI